MSQTQKQLDELPPRSALKVELPLETAPTAKIRQTTLLTKKKWLALVLVMCGTIFGVAIKFVFSKRQPLPQKTDLTTQNDPAQETATIMDLYRQKGAFVALPLFAKLAERFPDNARVIANLGTAQMLSENLVEAEATLQRALDMESGNAHFIATLGGLYLARNDFKKAYENLKRAAALSPEHPDILLSLAILHEKQNLLPQAVQYYSAFLRNGKASEDLHQYVKNRLRLLKSLAFSTTSDSAVNKDGSSVVQ